MVVIKFNSSLLLLSVAVASLLSSSSTIKMVNAEDPLEATGICEPNSAQCGNYSIARVIENGNEALSDFSTVGGGRANLANGDDYAVIGGGITNEAEADHSTISGGELNYIYEESAHATINGGRRNNYITGGTVKVKNQARRCAERSHRFEQRRFGRHFERRVR